VWVVEAVVRRGPGLGVGLSRLWTWLEALRDAGGVTWGGLCDVAGPIRLWSYLVSFCGFDELRIGRVGGCVCGYGGFGDGGVVSAVDYVAAGPLMF
jgi:hypothetical protein